MKRYIFFVLLCIQCDKLIEFPIPETIEIELPKANTSIQAVWERVKQSETGFVLFEKSETDLWLEGIVTSSDATGNFYKELYLQDQPNDPTRGMRLLLDQTALHTLYPIGMKIYVNLNGLGAGMEGGVLSLGSFQADGVANIPQPLLPNHIVRSEVFLEIVPKKTTIHALSEATRGLWIQLDEIQFARSEKGKTFAGEAFDTFDGERWINSCESFLSTIVSSSSFSKFKSVVLYSLSGLIRAIHTRDYYNEKDILKINNPSDFNLQNNRCDHFFEESFETHPLGRFMGSGWLNWVESGTVYWEVYEDENSLGQSLRIGSYRSGNKNSLCWLITPLINIRNLAQPFFSFRTSTAFADSSALEVFYSTNFSGNESQIKNATWIPLEGLVASEEDNDLLWIDSGILQLNNIKESVYFAFRYTGSGKTASDGTFELDDIRIFEVDR